VLIVLDNAAGEAQVRLLLPGSGASLTLITSRRRLTGLDTAHRLSLVPLSRGYAVQMLTNLMGQHAPADDDAVAHLAELGGNLPLALRLIGNRLASHGDARSSRFVQRLSDTERRLETLTAGDMRISAVFTSSYVQLSPEAQRLFRRLPLAPGDDTGPEMAAVLADRSLETTELALDELVEYGMSYMKSSPVPTAITLTPFTRLADRAGVRPAWRRLRKATAAPSTWRRTSSSTRACAPSASTPCKSTTSSTRTCIPATPAATRSCPPPPSSSSSPNGSWDPIR
jgi:hypothetical protein